MITAETATRLRAIAIRVEGRGQGTFEQKGAQFDAAELRDIAERIEERLRPRTRREREGEPRRRLRRAVEQLCRLWSRAA